MIETILLSGLLVWKFFSDLLESSNRKKVKTVCTYCGEKADNQPIGNGCHTCLMGTMRPVEYNGINQ